jgi:NAD(P)H-quinone oxidoreductase subunit N
LTNLSPKSKGLIVWIIDGHVLSNDELDYLVNLPKVNPKVKIVVEMGGDRVFRWQPLSQSLAA